MSAEYFDRTGSESFTAFFQSHSAEYDDAPKRRLDAVAPCDRSETVSV